MSKRNKNHKNLGSIYSIIAAIVVILDQIAKHIVVKSIDTYDSVVVIPKFFSFTHVLNTGAGFGILQNYNAILLFISVIVLGGILFYWNTVTTHFERICMSLIVGGIIGNLIDRLTRGYVVDFLEFHFWPTFNLADAAICIGVLGLLYYSVKYD